MKNIPNKLHFAGLTYKIKTVDALQDERGKDLVGQVEYHKRQIQLLDMDQEFTKKVLVHEMTHALLEEYGMQRFNKEDFVDRLSAALFDFFTRNDMHWLTGQPPLVIQNTLSDEEIMKWVDEFKNQPLTILNEPSVAFGKVITPEVEYAFDAESLERMTTPAPDQKAEQKEEPEHWKTGIKTGRKGEHRYKTHVICPDCRSKTNAYIPETQYYWNCYNCGTKLAVHFATDGGFPERDDFGNFFVAYDYFDPTTAGDFTPEEFHELCEGEDRKDD